MKLMYYYLWDGHPSKHTVTTVKSIYNQYNRLTYFRDTHWMAVI